MSDKKFLYAMRKAEGICVRCGMNQAADGRVMCSECAAKTYRRTSTRQYNECICTNRVIEKKPKYTLSEVMRMADERGISYGQMVIELEGRNNVRSRPCH